MNDLYTDEEIHAVFERQYGDTNIQFEDMTQTQLARMMNTMDAHWFVLRMRVRAMWREIVDSWKGDWK